MGSEESTLDCGPVTTLGAATTACGHCEAVNRDDARFCKGCGAALRPPLRCPQCGTTVPQDARFCSGCGTRLVGTRRDPVTAQPAQAETPPRPETTLEGIDLAALPKPEMARATLEALKRRPKPTRARIGINVISFVAVLLVFIVVMVVNNKNKPKEMSPFQGGPAPAMGGGSEATADSPTLGGTIRLDPSLPPSNTPAGVLFVLVRRGGMPDQGPPLAVKRFAQPKFPLSFSIGSSDAMIPGTSLEGELDLYARLDRDGDAMTHDPDDLLLDQPQRTKLGESELALVLHKKRGAVGAVLAPTNAPLLTPGEALPDAAAGGSLTGVVKIDPLFAREPVLQSGTLFLAVRPGGMGDRGPPVAAKRIDHPTFPLRFEISETDVMMQGAPFVGPFDVSARLDADGNAMSKQPGDLTLSAPRAGARPGGTGLELVLDKRL